MRSAKNAVDAGFVAVRISEMLKFYRDVLGLEYVEVFQTPVGAIHRLRFGASFIKIVDASATGSEAVQTSTYNDAGLRYLTFETPDIEDTWQRAVDSGASVVIALQSAPGGGPRSGTFRDPEGNLVELLCRTPSA
jgi:predicted enzyme related to lactoylglutathione lyase